MIEFICYFLYFLFPVVGNLIALNNIIRNKLTLRDNVTITLITMTILLIFGDESSILKNIAVFIIPIIFIGIKIKSIFKVVIIQFLIFVILSIIDSFMYSIIYVFLNNTYTIYSISYFMTSIVMIVVLTIITKFIGNFIYKYKNSLLASYKSKYLLMVYSMVFIAAAMFCFLINWNKCLEFETAVKIQSVIGFIYGVISVGVCICLLHMRKKEEKYRYEQIELRNLKEYTENLEELYTEMRRFRHDYINIISSISAFIQDRDCEGLQEYFNDNIQPLNKTINRNNYKLGLLKNIHLQEVKGLVSAKVIRAQELGVDVIIDVAEVIDNVDMDKIDLIRSLGILLDNAIDAAMESTSPKMSVALIKKDRSVIIVVSNTYGENILPIGKMFKEGVSTKGDNRGLGLSNLKLILNSYENISLDTYIKNNEFIQEVCIYRR